MTNSPIIGLAGGIGSGKSTIAQCFKKLGIHYVDADDVSRRVVQLGSDCLNQIHQHFGDLILLSDGTLNRKTLRNIIFNDPKEKEWLEATTHPTIRKEILLQLQQATSSYVLLVHPLLFETTQNEICNLNIAIDVPKKLQLQRVIRRDNITPDQAQKIINSQLSNQERLSRANLILENTGNIDDLNAKVLLLHKKILELIQC